MMWSSVRRKVMPHQQDNMAKVNEKKEASTPLRPRARNRSKRDSQGVQTKKTVSKEPETFNVVEAGNDNSTEISAPLIKNEVPFPQDDLIKPDSIELKQPESKQVDIKENSIKSEQVKNVSADDDGDVKKESAPKMDTDEPRTSQSNINMAELDDIKSRANSIQHQDSDSCSASVTSGEGRPSNRTGNRHPRINFRVGEKVEARDCFNMWYPSKIIQVDWDDREVLIHFERWNSRFDEWVTMDSPRLRAVTRTSSRKEKKEQRIHAAKGFRIGEVILAKWADCKMYPAKIRKILPDASCSVLFYDGFEKVVQSINLKKLPADMVGQVNFKSPPPPPVVMQPSSGDKKKHPSGGSDKKKHPSGSNDKSTDVKSKNSSSMEKTETPSKAPRSSSSNKSKSKTATSSQSVGNNKTSGCVMSGSSGGGIGGSSSKKRRLVVGGIFQAKRHVLTKTKLIQQMTPALVKRVSPIQFMTPSRSKVNKVSTPLVTGSSVKKRMFESNSKAMPETPKMTKCSETSDVSESSAPSIPPKAFVIEEDHNHFKCPQDGCGKAFRKPSLLSSHMKHYHRPQGKPAMAAETSTTSSHRSRRPSESFKDKPIKHPKEQVEPSEGSIMTTESSLIQTQASTPVKAVKTAIPHKKPPKAEVAPGTTEVLTEHQTIKPEANMDRKQITEKRRQLLLQRRLEGIYKKRQQQALLEKTRLAMLEKSRQQRRARQARVCEMPTNPPCPSQDATEDFNNPAQLMVEAVYEDSKLDESIELKYGGVKRKLYPDAGAFTEASIKPEIESFVQEVGAPKRQKRFKRISGTLENLKSEQPIVKPEVLAISPKRAKRVKRGDEFIEISDDESTTSAASELNGSFSETVEDQKMFARLTREFNQFTKSRQSFKKAREARGRGEISREEVVNCRCELQEEEGLMMQCEVCLAWQHGECFNIDDEDHVPEKYVCFACESPRRQRRSFRYRHHQDWFKRGSLATFSFLPKREDDWELKANMLRTHNLASQMFAVNQVMHSLRRKLQVVKDQDPSDLEFWSSPWCDATPDFTVTGMTPRPPINQIQPVTNPAACEDSFNFSDHSYSSVNNSRTGAPDSTPAVVLVDEPEIEGIQITISTSSTPPPVPPTQQVQEQQQPTTKDDVELEKISTTVASLLKIKTKEDDSSVEPVTATSQVIVTNGVVDSVDVNQSNEPNNVGPSGDHAAIEVGCQIEQKTKTNDKVDLNCATVDAETFNKIRTSVPKEFDVYECQVNVLDHIEQLQEELDKRMDELSEQLEELESCYEPLPSMPNNNSNNNNNINNKNNKKSTGDSTPDMFRSKRLLKCIMTDLNKVRRMSLYC